LRPIHLYPQTLQSQIGLVTMPRMITHLSMPRELEQNCYSYWALNPLDTIKDIAYDQWRERSLDMKACEGHRLQLVKGKTVYYLECVECESTWLVYTKGNGDLRVGPRHKGEGWL
jgi:hypothetical protein